MGLFFESRTASPELVDLVSSLISKQPTAQGEAEGGPTDLNAKSDAVKRILRVSPKARSTTSVKALEEDAAQVLANELLGGSPFNTGRFVIATAMFASLIGGGIATEATHLTTASGTLFGFAGAIFGIVTAFLGSEKSN